MEIYMISMVNLVLPNGKPVIIKYSTIIPSTTSTESIGDKNTDIEDVNRSEENFGFKRTKKIYDLKEEFLKSAELNIAVENIKKAVQKSGGKVVLPTKQELEKVFKMQSEELGIQHDENHSTRIFVINGVCLSVSDMAWKGEAISMLVPIVGSKLHDKRLYMQKKKLQAMGIRCASVGISIKLPGKGRGGRDKYVGRKVTGTILYKK
jgi:hypothetical protein